MKNTGKLSDEEIIERYKSSLDKELVGVLFNRYSHLVFGVCLKYLKNKEESKDLLFRIFEKLFDDLKTHQVANFKGWLYVLAKNQCLMELRKKGKIKEDERDVFDVNPPVEEEQVSAVEKDKQLNNMEAAIEQLNEKQKTCIRLFYLQDKCYDEVSEITGYTINEVKSYIQNGKRNLKIMLSDQP